MLDFDDLNTYLMLFEVAKRYEVDPSSSLDSETFFRNLLKGYPGSFDDEEEKTEWLDRQIGQHFIALGRRPEWIQDPQWPFVDGKPMVFAGQIDIAVRDESTDFFHDDTSLYIFVGRKVKPIVVIQQQ